MGPSEDANVITMKAGNMILNRFCIDEDAAFELSGVMDLKKSSWKMRHSRYYRNSLEFEEQKSSKGKEYSFL